MLSYDIKRLEKQRAILGMTCRELCRQVGICPSTYRRVITGENRNPRTVKRIADVLGVPMAEIVEFEAESSETTSAA